ncbi:hypothetical protein COBT_001126 [Conglomerata obtusa]
MADFKNSIKQSMKKYKVVIVGLLLIVVIVVVVLIQRNNSNNNIDEELELKQKCDLLHIIRENIEDELKKNKCVNDKNKTVNDKKKNLNDKNESMVNKNESMVNKNERMVNKNESMVNKNESMVFKNESMVNKIETESETIIEGLKTIHEEERLNEDFNKNTTLKHGNGVEHVINKNINNNNKLDLGIVNSVKTIGDNNTKDRTSAKYETNSKKRQYKSINASKKHSFCYDKCRETGRCFES